MSSSGSKQTRSRTTVAMRDGIGPGGIGSFHLTANPMEGTPMATDDTKHLPSKPSGSQTLAANASRSLAAAYSERLTMSEAVEAVGRMLAAFPNTRDGVRDGYMGVMAQLLTRYPRQTALRCAHPIDGVIRECKFLPTVAEAIKWLEREQLPLQRASDWERRSREQLAERDREYLQSLSLEERRAFAAQILDQLRERGFKFPGDCPTLATVDAAREHLRTKYGVTDEQIDALPNQSNKSDFWQGVRWPAT